MSVHLVGGGWDPDAVAAVYGVFHEEATAAAAGATPRFAVLVVVPDGPEEPDSQEAANRFTPILESIGACEVIVTAIGETVAASAEVGFDAVSLAGAHGVLVGGGLTPAYRRAVEPIAGELRRLVASGLPYLGFSAGAAIAADTAILGGWRIGGVPVAHEDVGEDLDEVTVEAGIGLVDLSVDVHAAQWGTLTRLIAATEAGLVDGGIAIDENTVFSITPQGLRVAGAGTVWSVTGDDDGVVVRSVTG